MNLLQAPWPYFGGKAIVAKRVWRRFGKVRNYVEPFFGSGAVLLNRPTPFEGTETVNDLDGFISNFWRAVRSAPDKVAYHADWPVNENDLHARHAWLVGHKDSLQARLEGDPDYYDAKVAGWWCWGMCCWIGSGFCTGQGPWRQVQAEDGSWVLTDDAAAGGGTWRQRVHLGDAGRGVNRKLVHLGDAGRGVNRKRVHLGNAGQGVNRKRVHLGDAGRGVNRQLVAEDADEGVGIYAWMAALSARLGRVRVCCGDWSRVCGPTPTVKQGLTAVFLDPPYSDAAGRDNKLYRQESLDVAHDAREWCLEWGDHKLMRIALCGYEGEHEELERHGWTVEAWKANGGYGGQGDHDNPNSRRERCWFSPHCLGEARYALFANLKDEDTAETSDDEEDTVH